MQAAVNRVQSFTRSVVSAVSGGRMAEASSKSPPWREAIEQSIEANKELKYSKYCQLVGILFCFRKSGVGGGRRMLAKTVLETRDMQCTNIDLNDGGGILSFYLLLFFSKVFSLRTWTLIYRRINLQYFFYFHDDACTLC